MNDDSDRIVQTLLQQARAAAEPKPAELARALKGVRARVLPRASNEVPQRSAARTERELERLQTGGLRQPAARLAALRTPLGFASWGALTAAIGFAVGVRYARDTAPHELALAQPAAVQAPLVAPAGERAAAAPVLSVPASPPLNSVPSSSVPSSSVPSRAVAPSRGLRTPAPRAAERRPGLRVQALPGNEPRAPLLEFHEVLDHVRRAERAVRGGEPALALALLGELDEQASARTLHDERSLTRVLALCAQGEAELARAASLELGAADGSIYAGRLAKSCVAATDTVRTPAAVDTHAHEHTP